VTDSVFYQRLAAISAILAGLAACTPAPLPPPPVVVRRAPPHFGPPKAADCTVAPFFVADGGAAVVNMTMGNDGGYCAATLITSAAKPFDAALVTMMPYNGTPAVWKYDGKTSVEYVPNAGFSGIDHFTIELLIAGKPGMTTLNVTVNVSKPAAKP
jgi:hypothetical protein